MLLRSDMTWNELLSVLPCQTCFCVARVLHRITCMCVCFGNRNHIRLLLFGLQTCPKALPDVDTMISHTCLLVGKVVGTSVALCLVFAPWTRCRGSCSSSPRSSLPLSSAAAARRRASQANIDGEAPLLSDILAESAEGLALDSWLA